MAPGQPHGPALRRRRRPRDDRTTTGRTVDPTTETTDADRRRPVATDAGRAARWPGTARGDAVAPLAATAPRGRGRRGRRAAVVRGASRLTGASPTATVLGYVPADSVMYGEVRLDLPGDQRQQSASSWPSSRASPTRPPWTPSSTRSSTGSSRRRPTASRRSPRTSSRGSTARSPSPSARCRTSTALTDPGRGDAGRPRPRPAVDQGRGAGPARGSTRRMTESGVDRHDRDLRGHDADRLHRRRRRRRQGAPSPSSAARSPSPATSRRSRPPSTPSGDGGLAGDAGVRGGPGRRRRRPHRLPVRRRRDRSWTAP